MGASAGGRDVNDAPSDDERETDRLFCLLTVAVMAGAPGQMHLQLKKWARKIVVNKPPIECQFVIKISVTI